MAPIVAQYGYFSVGGLLLLEDFGIPVPGETVLIAAAFFAGLGHLNIGLVFLVAFLGAVIGDNIGFLIGRRGGRPLVERFGKYIFLTPKRLDATETFFKRHGGRIIVVARFIEGLRQLNGIIAGMSGIRWKTFLTFNIIGALLWVGTWSAAGYFGGAHIDLFLKYQLYATIAIFAALLIFVLIKIIEKRRRTA